MSTPALDAALDEITAERAEWAPVVEGHKDYQRLNLEGESPTAVAEAAHESHVLLEAMDNAIAALEALNAAGYPALEPFEVTPEVLADLQANAATINAALAQYTASEQATSLNLAVGAAEPKNG